MNQLRTEGDVATMLSGEGAALFVFVGWSEYARLGLRVFKEAEENLAATSSKRPISWWVADITHTDTPLSSVLHQWLTTQEQRGKVRMFPGIAVGNGSVVWMKSGEVVEFHDNAERLGADALARRTEQILTES